MRSTAMNSGCQSLEDKYFITLNLIVGYIYINDMYTSTITAAIDDFFSIISVDI